MNMNGLVTLQVLFVRNTVYPERHTISTITDTRKKEWKLYPTNLEHLIILNTRN